MRTEIIYEDKSVLVCYKPAGLAVQTAKIGQQDMASELKNYLAQNPKGFDGYLGILHRLDQPVEGLLVFAKEKKAAADLSRQLQKGILNKNYYAVVCGRNPEQEGTLTDYLAKTPDNRAVVLKEKEKGQRAVLHYKLTEMSCCKAEDDVKVYMAQICIETGRFHQIRVQMSHAGMPLLGDKKYGNDKSVTLSSMLRVANVALCAFHLGFCHPVSHKFMEFQIKPRAQIFGMVSDGKK